MGCGKPHPEQDCFFLHPEKRPKGWKTPERKRHGRDRDRGGRERKRSQTRSNDRKDNRSDDRRGEPSKNGKRDKSPPKIRTLNRERRSGDEDDSSQERKELESRLEKLKEKKTRRLRKEIFDNEELYIDLQRSWSGSGGRQNVKTVRTSSPLIQGAAVVTFQQSPGSLGHKNEYTNKEGEDEHFVFH